MSDLVDADRIEQIVGARRHRTAHLGRAVSAEERVYILHSQACKDSGIDLRDCDFSVALDVGISMPQPWKLWSLRQDVPVLLGIISDFLVPVTVLDGSQAGVTLLPALSTIERSDDA